MYRMFRIFLLLFILQFSIVSGLELYGYGEKLTSPEVAGFKLKSEPSYYTEDNLYEYINGAADLFLSYYFKKLSVFDYRNMEKASITIDIYEHKDIKNGFGIYCSEKPSEGEFLRIGTEGYYEQGILNFFKGKYYVKISAFGIKENEKDILVKLAKTFSKQFKTETGNPEVLIAFPEKNRIENSEKYISKNFLGHSFLHSAFITDYSVNETAYQVFVIETENEVEIKKIIENYKSFLKKKNILMVKVNGVLTFTDPYYKNKGMMFLKFRKNHLWGLFCKDKKKAMSIINLIDSRLKKTF